MSEQLEFSCKWGKQEREYVDLLVATLGSVQLPSKDDFVTLHPRDDDRGPFVSCRVLGDPEPSKFKPGEVYFYCAPPLEGPYGPPKQTKPAESSAVHNVTVNNVIDQDNKVKLSEQSREIALLRADVTLLQQWCKSLEKKIEDLLLVQRECLKALKAIEAGEQDADN